MTREEHILNLETIGCDGWTVSTQAKESLEWAISKLKENKGDLISRRAVTDIIERKRYKYDAIAEIERLPSAENKGEPIECARILKKHCFDTTDCKKCFMWDERKYELSAPCNWDLPEGEKGGE